MGMRRSWVSRTAEVRSPRPFDGAMIRISVPRPPPAGAGERAHPDDRAPGAPRCDESRHRHIEVALADAAVAAEAVAVRMQFTQRIEGDARRDVRGGPSSSNCPTALSRSGAEEPAEGAKVLVRRRNSASPILPGATASCSNEPLGSASRRRWRNRRCRAP